MPNAHGFPDVGDLAVDFTLPSTRGPLHLAELLEHGSVLLVFHPRDNTLVCTRQLCNYRDHLSMFEAFDTQIVAINEDPIETHQSFAKKFGFPFPLASDTERKVCHAYGVLLDLFRIRRSLVLIGEDRRIWWRHAELRVFHRSADDLQRVLEELHAHK